MTIYIVVTLVALFLLTLLFFSFKSTVKRVNVNTKKFFLDKLQDYDVLIEQKQNLLKELNDSIDKKRIEMENVKKIDKENKISTNINKYNPDLKISNYEDENLLKKYKKIKQKFNLDYEKIILEFLNNNKDYDLDKYKLLLGIKEKITNEKIYDILKTKKTNQQSEFIKLFNSSEQKFIINNFNLKNFQINKFMIKLNSMIKSNDFNIYIYTGNKAYNFNHISDRIKTLYDEKINEGIRIIYKGNLYDYSL